MLLAEDNDLNAEIATELLTEAELKAEQAADSVACVEMLAKASHGLLRHHFDGDSDADRERLHLRLSIDMNVLLPTIERHHELLRPYGRGFEGP